MGWGVGVWVGGRIKCQPVEEKIGKGEIIALNVVYYQ